MINDVETTIAENQFLPKKPITNINYAYNANVCAKSRLEIYEYTNNNKIGVITQRTNPANTIQLVESLVMEPRQSLYAELPNTISLSFNCFCVYNNFLDTVK